MSECRNPDLKWYQSISLERQVTPRCPFAAFRKCPKYYFSYSLTDSFGITAALSKEDDKKIMEYWSETSYLPMPREIEPCINGIEKKNIRNFCPEVVSKIYGIFASSIYHYVDDIDIEIAEKALIKEQADRDDCRWIYSSIVPVHYLDCEYYSIIAANDRKIELKQNEEDIIDIKPNIYGVGININALIRKLKGKIEKSLKKIKNLT